MQPSWNVLSEDGTDIAVYELGGEGDVLLIAHATGLCGAMYQLLADELTNTYRVVALDFRGHGNSVGGDDIDLHWDRMAADVLAVTAQFGPASIHGFGHSMGGAALLLAEARQPGTFRSFYLFEPIMFPDMNSTAGQNVMATNARRRRSEFGSRAEAIYRYASRPPFNQVRSGFLVAYVENGFAELPDGRVRLKCLPEVEARTFEGGRESRMSDVQGVLTPTTVAVGHDEEGPNPARFGPALAETLAAGQLVSYAHIGHFGPLEDPWTVARDIRQHIQAAVRG